MSINWNKDNGTAFQDETNYGGSFNLTHTHLVEWQGRIFKIFGKKNKDADKLSDAQIWIKTFK